MEFTSQICTTEDQSKRLLSLGLKKETADMRYRIHYFDLDGILLECIHSLEPGPPLDNDFIPAWSLHRLICLTNPYLSINPFGNIEIGGKSFSDIYEGLISTIEYNVKEGYFNKVYLEE